MNLQQSPTEFSRNDLLIDFAYEHASLIFSALILFYLIQILIALYRSTQPFSPAPVQDKSIQITLLDAAKSFDGGLRNIWTFFILVIFVPAFFATLGDMTPLIDDPKALSNIEQKSIPASDPVGQLPDGTLVTVDPSVDADALNALKKADSDAYERALRSAASYFLCVSILVVLITLEFSYLHNLRRSATEWVSMLLVALALDLATMLTITLLLRNPHGWTKALASSIEIFMWTTTVLALLSSFLILVLARTAGAVFDNQVDLRSIDYNDKKSMKEQRRANRSKLHSNSIQKKRHGQRGQKTDSENKSADTTTSEDESRSPASQEP